MDFGFWDVIQIVGALAFFVFGMKMMSDGVQRAAGSQLRTILRTMTKNRFFGVGTGFLTTALVQSSSATTVMTVSFVNAGLLTLMESAGIMMGANIGTTITGWIVSMLGFKLSLSSYSIPLFAIGIPMLFIDKGKSKYWGEFIIGFAILFLGLSYLKDAVPDLADNSEVLDFLSSFTNWGIFSRILFVAVGTLITVIVQSSSAAMAITLTMCAQGWLPFEVAAAMILGENIGTTITAELASLVGNTNAKRSARIHSMFNIVGVTWMVILLPYFLPALSYVAQNYLNISDPYQAEGMALGLSAFHTAFNLLNVIIMIGFVNTLVKIAIWSVPNNDDKKSSKGLKLISTGIRTPELAIVELQKETAHFGEVASEMSGLTRELINTTEYKAQNKLLKKLRKYEKQTDRMEIEITEYISKMASQEMTNETSSKLHSLLNACNDLERIGDVFYQISKTIEQKNKQGLSFLPEQRANLIQMLILVDSGFVEMISNLNADHYSKINLDRAKEIEESINTFRNKLKNDNLTRLGQDDYPVKSAMIYNNVFSSLEKVGDHIINISEAISGEV